MLAESGSPQANAPALFHMNFLPQPQELSCPYIHERVTKEGDLNLSTGWLLTCRRSGRWLLRAGNDWIERSGETLLRPGSSLQRKLFLQLIFLRVLPPFSTIPPHSPHTYQQFYNFPELVRDQTPHQQAL